MRNPATPLALALSLAAGLVAAAALAEGPPPPPVAEAPAPPPVPAPPGTSGISVGVELGNEDDALQVLTQLPPDVRAKLDGDQLEQIVRRAQEGDQSPPAVAIVAPVAFFLTVFAVVCAILFARFRREKQLHETLRQMIDRGVDIPPAMLVPPQVKPNDRRRGVILISVGVGISAFLFLVDGKDDGAWGLGLVPAFLGAGYLLASYLAKRDDA